jgi:hypothetical protein
VLGLSLSKILVTILIVVAIWKALTLVNRLANDRRAKVERQSRAARQDAKSSQARRSSTVELRPCPRCGAYVDPRHGCQCGLRPDEARRANL